MMRNKWDSSSLWNRLKKSVMGTITAHLARAMAIMLMLLAAAQPISACVCWCECEEQSAECTIAGDRASCCRKHGESSDSSRDSSCHRSRCTTGNLAKPNPGHALGLKWHPCSCPQQCECLTRHASGNVLTIEVEQQRSESSLSGETNPNAFQAFAEARLRSSGIQHPNARLHSPSRTQLCRFVI